LHRSRPHNCFSKHVFPGPRHHPYDCLTRSAMPTECPAGARNVSCETSRITRSNPQPPPPPLLIPQGPPRLHSSKKLCRDALRVPSSFSSSSSDRLFLAVGRVVARRLGSTTDWPTRDPSYSMKWKSFFFFQIYCGAPPPSRPAGIFLVTTTMTPSLASPGNICVKFLFIS
jgi:hypothetical protein